MAARWAGAAVLLAALATGGYLFAHQGVVALASGESPAGPSPSVTLSAASPPPPPSVPAHYRLVRDPLGFALAVPDGWTRAAAPDGTRADYIDPTDKADLRIDVLDFAGPNPIQHWRDLEPAVKAKSPGYHLLRMNATTRAVDGGDGRVEPAAIWEWTWKGQQRQYHAIDLGFGKEGGSEFAVYLSAPDFQWTKWVPAFDAAARTFRPTAS